MSQINYCQTVPNSHFWSNLKGIIYSIELQEQREAQENENTNVIYASEPFTSEYLLVGLNNCIKNGYRLTRIKYPERLRGISGMNYFTSINEMIEYIESEKYDRKYFYETLKTMCSIGFNLTNGKKMERRDVYKRIDGERDYQDKTWVARRTADGTPDEEKPVAEWINYIEYHLSKAKERVYHLDTQAALAEIRKVTALGVRTMEIHGCPERVVKLDTSPNAPDPNFIWGDSNGTGGTPITNTLL